MGRTGVASTASNVFMYFSLKKKLNVVSDSAPDMADTASMAGATNEAYSIVRPPTVRFPTRAPTPIDSRYSSGSKNPDASTIQYAGPERSAPTLRLTTAPTRPGETRETTSVVIISLRASGGRTAPRGTARGRPTAAGSRRAREP